MRGKRLSIELTSILAIFNCDSLGNEHLGGQPREGRYDLCDETKT